MNLLPNEDDGPTSCCEGVITQKILDAKAPLELIVDNFNCVQIVKLKESHVQALVDYCMSRSNLDT